jgi:prenyltransferase beta subunit
MKRSVLLVLIVPLLPSLVRAQAPDASEKQATVAYVQALQTPEGGFLPMKASSPGKPSLRATGPALRALKYFGGAPRDKEACCRFVESCFDKNTGAFSDQPGGKPDVIVTAVGLMALVELNLPTERYADSCVKFLGEHAKSFEEIRMAAAGFEAVGKRAPEAQQWVAELARTSNPDGTFGKDTGLARDAGGAVVAELRLGAQLSPTQRANVLKALKNGQRPDGGFGKAGTPDSDLESAYRIVRCLIMLKERPANVAALKQFIGKCRNADGGYGVAPGQPSGVSGTYFAGILTHWLQEP